MVNWRPTILLLSAFKLVCSVASYTPSGTQLKVRFALSTGTTVYLKVDALGTAQSGSFDLTTEFSSADVFTLDTTTGYLFTPRADATKYPSGYGVVYAPVFGLTSVISATPLFLEDGDKAKNTPPSLTNVATPWKCTLGTVTAGSGPLSCGFENTVLNGLTICAGGTLAGELQAFASSLTTVLSLCLVTPPTITGTAAIIYTGPVIRSPSASSSLGLFPSTAGSCSVTLELYLTTTTIWVAPGATTVGKSGGASIGTVAYSASYGCTPVTRTISIN